MDRALVLREVWSVMITCTAQLDRVMPCLHAARGTLSGLYLSRSRVFVPWKIFHLFTGAKETYTVGED